MQQRVLRVIGSSFILFGAILALNSFQTITGYVVFAGADVHFGSLIAIFLIVGGILILSVSQESWRDRESRLIGMIGDEKYERLTEEEKHTYNKALRRNEKKEEKHSRADENEDASSRLYISNGALERAKKDPYVFANRERFLNEIQRIARNPEARQQEQIGDFSISPQGHTMIRVAWHYDAQTKTIFIDDLLYHQANRRYVDDWNKRARGKKITRKIYEDKGYVAFNGKL
ncbi:hypothetical protein HYZ97_02250 [Candidatus Pacearchaeota archaeon]|nr:hypothetical protein [Candidatus Pacearchaeota archaeon]